MLQKIKEVYVVHGSERSICGEDQARLPVKKSETWRKLPDRGPNVDLHIMLHGVELCISIIVWVYGIRFEASSGALVFES